MNRKLIVSKLKPAYAELMDVWSQTYRYVEDPQRRSVPAGVAEWYLRLRLERSCLEEHWESLIRGNLEDHTLVPFAERVITFAQMLVQLENVVVIIESDPSTLLDRIEDLSAVL